jgi:hypothetical protein
VNGPIVDIGEILDLDDFVALPFQVATQDILAEERPEVSDVGAVLYRGATRVHRDALGFQGLELLQTAR